MPLYDYLCSNCEYLFEEFVRSADPDATKYHVCRCGSQAKKIPSIPSSPRGAFGTTKRNNSRDTTTRKIDPNKKVD